MSTYTVKSGDTTATIAAKYGVTLAALEAVNPQVTNPNNIQVGQVLTIPSGTLRYTVKSGETMATIAAKFDVTLAALEAVNPQVTNPALIQVGQVLRIPVFSGTYTVKSGDTMATIAAKFGVTLAALEAANPQITNPNNIQVGQLLIVPGLTPSTPARNIIYYNDGSNQIPLAGIATLPYTDVIVAFLIPDGNLNLYGAGGAFGPNLQSDIQTLQHAGKKVLISVGGDITYFTSSNWQSYAQNVNGLVGQIASFVTSNGFDGVDIDYEDDNGFTGSYDGIGFLTSLTNALAQALPQGHNIITHAPQTPYWVPNAGFNSAYTQIWQQVGNKIAWINNQFYNNAPWDGTPALKVQWYQSIASITGAKKLTVGAGVAAAAVGEGYIPVDQMVQNVIAPLKVTFGAQFGGVMGWEFSYDNGGSWANGIGQALNTK
jgi:chitinase